MILIPSQAQAPGPEELSAAVSDGVLNPPDSSGLRGLLLVEEETVGRVHSGPHLRVSGGLDDGGQEVPGVQGRPVQHDSVASPLCPHHVRLLVVTQWYPHYGCGVEQRLLHTWIFKYHI